MVKSPSANARDIRDAGFNPWVGKIPWKGREGMQNQGGRGGEKPRNSSATWRRGSGSPKGWGEP